MSFKLAYEVWISWWYFFTHFVLVDHKELLTEKFHRMMRRASPIFKKPISQREQQTCRIIFTQYDRGKVSSFYYTETQLAH